MFNGLPEDHGAETRKNFKKVHGWDQAGESPFFGEDERQTEDVVGNSGEQAGGEADDDGAPELAVASEVIETGDGEKDEDRRQKDEGDKNAHRAEAIKIEEEARDGGGGEEENAEHEDPFRDG